MERSVDQGVPGAGSGGLGERSCALLSSELGVLRGCRVLRLSGLSLGCGPVWSTADPWHLEACFQKAQ